MMKRLCIYLTYDSQGIVDAYIGYMLKELRTVSDHLVVVCNQPQVMSGYHFLAEYADAIYFRENIGYDAGGFKDALCQYIGWEKVREYDELLLVNDSFFGPFCPMRKIFDEMAERECDFWGLSAQKEGIEHEGTIVALEYVQSFFLAFRNKVLYADSFKNFWETMPYYRSFTETILKYEKQLTYFLHDEGYHSTSYADMEANDADNIINNFNQFTLISNELVQKRNFPFLKKQQIAYNMLNQQTQENIPLVLDYIKNHTAYDVRMIYENIIRSMNISDLYQKLCLHYILPNGPMKDNSQDLRAVIVVIAEYGNSFEYVMEYIQKLSDRYHVLVLSKSETVISNYVEKGIAGTVCMPQNKNAIIDKLTSYHFVCVLHDADMSSDREPSFIGKSKFYNIWENLLSNADYIMRVLDLFDKNEKLGLLTIPSVNFGDYFGSIGKGWDGKFDEVNRCIERYHIQCNLEYIKPPFEIFENYWIRGELFESIRTWEIEFLELLPWMWCYVAQGQGYFSGVVESSDYAGMNEINKQYYLDAICAQVREQLGVFHNFREFQEILSRRAVIDYCQKYEKVYVYGTGNIAEQFSHIIPNIEAYVVSDGQNKLQLFHSKKVLFLSEMNYAPDRGVVICLDKKNQAQVIPQLLKYGLKDYFCV